MRLNLPELCDIQYGYAFDSTGFTEDSSYPPVVRIRDVKRGYSETYFKGEYPKEYTLHAGDLLIGMDGEFNLARWKSRDALLNQRVCKITAKKGTNEEYLRFALSKALKEIENRTAFVTVKHLSAKELNKLELQVPILSEQNRIADILRLIERVISLRSMAIQRLDDLIKARFVEMFGDKTRYPQEPLGASVHEMFIGPFGSSLKNECFVDESEGYCIVYEQKHAIQKTMDVPTRYVPKIKYEELKRFSVYPGDIIVSCRGTLGEVFIIPEGAPLGIMHPSIMKIRLNTEKYNQKFFVLALEQYMEEHNSEAKGSGVKMAVTATTLGRELFVLPPMDVQEQFSSFVAQVNKSKVVVQKAIDEAQLLFDSLMQKYFG